MNTTLITNFTIPTNCITGEECRTACEQACFLQNNYNAIIGFAINAIVLIIFIIMNKYLDADNYLHQKIVSATIYFLLIINTGMFFLTILK